MGRNSTKLTIFKTFIHLQSFLLLFFFAIHTHKGRWVYRSKRDRQRHLDSILIWGSSKIFQSKCIAFLLLLYSLFSIRIVLLHVQFNELIETQQTQNGNKTFTIECQNYMRRTTEILICIWNNRSLNGMIVEMKMKQTNTCKQTNMATKKYVLDIWICSI